MRRTDLLRHLEQHGCVFVREGSNHTIYLNPATRARAPIPRHRVIEPPLVLTICKQLGVPSP